ASVSPTSYTGACPKNEEFTGTFSVNKPGSVTYRWVKSDGTSSSDATWTFGVAGSKTVNYTWARSSSGSGFAQLKVVTPNELISNKASFDVTCEEAKDFSGSWYHNFGTANLTQSGNSVTGTYYNGFSDASGTIAGTVSGNVLTGTWAISGG